MAVRGKVFVLHYHIYPCPHLHLTAAGAVWHLCASCSFSFPGLHSKKKVAEGKVNVGNLNGLIGHCYYDES
jgi:hypothetical protein